MAAAWDDAVIYRLIEIFETKRILWDSTNKSYKDKFKKNLAWEEMARAMYMPRKDVESKVHTLRSQFARERRKVARSEMKGTGAETSKWKFYDALSFLLIDTPKTTAKKKNFREMGQSIEFFTTFAPSTSGAFSSHLNAQYQPPTKIQKTAKRKLTDQLEEVIDVVKHANRELSESKDEFYFYGQYVASELRAVRNETAVLRAKTYINNVLIDMRMGKFDSIENHQSHAGAEDVVTSAGSLSCDLDKVKTEVPEVCESDNDNLEASEVCETDDFKTELSEMCEYDDFKIEITEECVSEKVKLKVSEVCESENVKIKVPGACESENVKIKVPGVCESENYKIKVPGVCESENYKIKVPGVCESENYKIKVPGVCESENYKIKVPGVCESENVKIKVPGACESENVKIKASEVYESDDVKAESDSDSDFYW